MKACSKELQAQRADERGEERKKIEFFNFPHSSVHVPGLKANVCCMWSARKTNNQRMGAFKID